MKILGYPVIGQVETTVGKFPLVDVPMLSDEQWQQLAKENAVHNYIQAHGQKPESVEAAVQWQRRQRSKAI